MKLSKYVKKPAIAHDISHPFKGKIYNEVRILKLNKSKKKKVIKEKAIRYDYEKPLPNPYKRFQNPIGTESKRTYGWHDGDSTGWIDERGRSI